MPIYAGKYAKYVAVACRAYRYACNTDKVCNLVSLCFLSCYRFSAKKKIYIYKGSFDDSIERQQARRQGVRWVRTPQISKM